MAQEDSGFSGEHGSVDKLSTEEKEDLVSVLGDHIEALEAQAMDPSENGVGYDDTMLIATVMGASFRGEARDVFLYVKINWDHEGACGYDIRIIPQQPRDYEYNARWFVDPPLPSDEHGASVAFVPEHLDGIPDIEMFLLEPTHDDAVALVSMLGLAVEQAESLSSCPKEAESVVHTDEEALQLAAVGVEVLIERLRMAAEESTTEGPVKTDRGIFFGAVAPYMGESRLLGVGVSWTSDPRNEAIDVYEVTITPTGMENEGVPAKLWRMSTMQSEVPTYECISGFTGDKTQAGYAMSAEEALELLGIVNAAHEQTKAAGGRYDE